MDKPTTDLVTEITQGALAVIALLLGGALTILGVILHSQQTGVPDWLSLLIGAIIASYFSRGSTIQAINAITNGPLHTIADMASQPRQVRATDAVQPTTQAGTQ